MVSSTGSRQTAGSSLQTLMHMSTALATGCHGHRDADDLTDVAKMHRAALLARARGLSRRSSDAWDLLQDTFERALRAMPRGLPSGDRLRWMLVVMHNLHFDRCRAQKRRQTVALTEDVACVEFDADKESSWRSIDPDQVRACLSRLDPRLRDAYVLQTEERLPLLMIAERLGIPVATAGTRLFRARRRLRELLEAECGPVESAGSQRTSSVDSRENKRAREDLAGSTSMDPCAEFGAVERTRRVLAAPSMIGGECNISAG